jgi:drug/metabolite transporter (DMT)-like permease
MIEIPDNDPLSRIMKSSRLEMPFSDFEESVMHRIKQEAMQQQPVSHDRKLSWVFFILGTVFGLIINSLLQNGHYSVPDISSASALLFFQVLFVLVFIIQLEKNLQLAKRWKTKQQRS